MQVTPFENGFGAEISEIRLSATDICEIQTVKKIESALIKYKVLKFVDQSFNPCSLAFFAAKFGKPIKDPFIESISPDFSVIEVKREKEETTPIFGGDWHSDWSFQAEPPKFSFLYGLKVPPRGGRTIFADCVRAYEELSEEAKKKVCSLQAIHSARRAYGPFWLFSRDDRSRSMKISVSNSAERIISHPTVRFIKESRKGAIFVNPVYTVGVRGIGRRESRNLIDSLCSHVIREEFRLPVTWSDGNLLIWDNRTVMHFAEGGYGGYERIMYRLTVGKERPICQKYLSI